MGVWNLEKLRERYEKRAAVVLCECTLATDLVGGLPAGREGVALFVKHQLQLEGDEAEKAIDRILKEEMGTVPIPDPEGELEEAVTKSVNMVRRDALGPFLASHMPKACIKTAASRLGLFMAKKGLKGDMSELGEARACGLSLLNLQYPGNIYFRDAESDAPPKTFFTEFKGRVQTPQGSVSIINNCECVPAGSRFDFEFRFLDGKLPEEGVVDIMSLAMVIGLGSCKAFDRGKFSIQRLTYVGAETAKAQERKAS